MDCFAEKSLPELIQSTPVRIDSVVQFIETVKPQIGHRVVPITDMFGPTITDPDLQCIVVSDETKKGGDIVNQERQKKVGHLYGCLFVCVVHIYIYCIYRTFFTVSACMRVINHVSSLICNIFSKFIPQIICLGEILYYSAVETMKPWRKQRITIVIKTLC